MVNDQRGTPTSALALAPQLLALAGTEAFGTYHATCQGETTWYEFARLILETAGLEAPVSPCTTAEFPRPAPRPANSVLANRLLQLHGLDRMPPWQAAYQEFWDAYGGQTMSWILVTGGAGFIGANFVHFLRRHRPDWRILNLDLLTYAGNPENLAGLAGRSPVYLGPGRRGRPGTGGRAFRPLPHHAGWCTSPRKPTWTGPSWTPGSLCAPTCWGPTPCWRRPARPGKRRRLEAPRFLHISTDEVYGSLGPDDPAGNRSLALCPPQPVCRLQGGGRSPGPGLFPYLWVAGAHHQLFQ